MLFQASCITTKYERALREWIVVYGKWLFIRFECEKVAKINSFRKKDKGLTKGHFLSGEKGRVNEIMQEEMQNEYNNNVFLAQVPQFCDKIYKLTKGIEKEKVPTFPKQS